MHDLVHILIAAASVAPSSTAPGQVLNQPSDNSLKIAIVTAISVVFAAAITALATTITRHREGEGSSDYVSELIRRAEVAENRSSILEVRNDSLTARVDELEDTCWHNGVDPNTGRRVPSKTHRINEET